MFVLWWAILEDVNISCMRRSSHSDHPHWVFLSIDFHSNLQMPYSSSSVFAWFLSRIVCLYVPNLCRVPFQGIFWRIVPERLKYEHIFQNFHCYRNTRILTQPEWKDLWGYFMCLFERLHKTEDCALKLSSSKIRTGHQPP